MSYCLDLSCSGELWSEQSIQSYNPIHVCVYVSEGGGGREEANARLGEGGKEKSWHIIIYAV